MKYESEPTGLKIIYEQPGGVLAIQTSPDRLKADLKNEKIKKALEACGLTPDLAEQLFVNSSTLPQIAEEDQFTDEPSRQKTEHVVTRELETSEQKVKLLQVDFYPPAVEFGGATIDSVFSNTSEIIFGLEGRGVLEVAPTKTEGDKIFLDQSKTKDLIITKGTLVILPPNVQGNRWKNLDSISKTEPSLKALFVAYPVAYEQATSRKLD